MHGLAMAALAARLMVTGGAGAEETRVERPPAAEWREVGKDYSTVREDVTSLRDAFRKSRAESAAKSSASADAGVTTDAQASQK